jgi:hypothetical protein
LQCPICHKFVNQRAKYLDKTNNKYDEDRLHRDYDMIRFLDKEEETEAIKYALPHEPKPYEMKLM